MNSFAEAKYPPVVEPRSLAQFRSGLPGGIQTLSKEVVERANTFDPMWQCVANLGLRQFSSSFGESLHLEVDRGSIQPRKDCVCNRSRRSQPDCKWEWGLIEITSSKLTCSALSILTFIVCLNVHSNFALLHRFQIQSGLNEGFSATINNNFVASICATALCAKRGIIRGFQFEDSDGSPFHDCQSS